LKVTNCPSDATAPRRRVAGVPAQKLWDLWPCGKTPCPRHSGGRVPTSIGRLGLVFVWQLRGGIVAKDVTRRWT
jgi:hypothetical protein